MNGRGTHYSNPEKETVEAAPAPDNDAAYEAMVHEAMVQDALVQEAIAVKAPAEDDDYEELMTPVYDVPRRAIPASFGTLVYGNAADGNDGGTAVVYYSSAGRLV